MDKITLHIPTVSFGFIEVEREYSLENKEKLYKEAVDDFKLISNMWKSPEVNKDPKLGQPDTLGQTKIENGHVYKAVKNEGSNTLYWLIDKV